MVKDTGRNKLHPFFLEFGKNTTVGSIDNITPAGFLDLAGLHMKATRKDSSQKPLSAFFGGSKENVKPKTVENKACVVVKPAVPAELQVERAQRQPSWWSRTSNFSQTTANSGSRKREVSQFVSQPAKRPAPWSGVAVQSVPRQNSPSLSGQKKLSEEQLKVLNRILNGKSVFFTGAAGTGKSYLLHSIVESLRRRLSGDQVAITATTGLAALNVGGQTIHRWGGLGLGRDNVSKLALGIQKRNDVLRRWRNCRVLIIDEVSMLEAELFEKMEELARVLRKDTRPFGGIQVVITGDFFQLPPVGRNRAVKLCFESSKWQEVIQEQMLLRKVFRQEDQRLIDMLNCMRVGKLTPEVLANFAKLNRAVCYEDGLEPTQLYPRREQVDNANRARMQNIKGREFVFKAEDSGTFDAATNAKLLENIMAPEKLVLKVGAQVLLISNIANDLVNGSRGRVKTFVHEEKHPQLRTLVQKAPPVLDIYNRMLENNGTIDVKMDEDMRVFLSEEERAQLLEIYTLEPRMPVVDFGVTNWFTLLTPIEYAIKGPPPHSVVTAARHQIPVILSWALSIHKAQGQTLDRLVVDLSNVFEKGQAYVAVSRATSYDRLQVIGFKESMIQVDPRVSEFYSQLESNI